MGAHGLWLQCVLGAYPVATALLVWAKMQELPAPLFVIGLEKSVVLAGTHSAGMEFFPL